MGSVEGNLEAFVVSLLIGIAVGAAIVTVPLKGHRQEIIPL